MPENVNGGEPLRDAELLSETEREIIRRNIEEAIFQERAALDGEKFLESDLHLGALLRHVFNEDETIGLPPTAAMSEAASSHVTRMVAVYLVDFGFEHEVQLGENELNTKFFGDTRLDAIHEARALAEGFAENGWQGVNEVWQAAHTDIHSLFVPNDSTQ